jgi:hypothetical protein
VASWHFSGFDAADTGRRVEERSLKTLQQRHAGFPSYSDLIAPAGFLDFVEEVMARAGGTACSPSASWDHDMGWFPLSFSRWWGPILDTARPHLTGPDIPPGFRTASADMCRDERGPGGCRSRPGRLGAACSA